MSERRIKVDPERLHRARLLAGAARYVAERASQEDDRAARKALMYVEALAELVERDLEAMLGEK